MQDFSEKSFLRVDSKERYTLKFLTALCGALLCFVSFLLIECGIPLDVKVVAVGATYAVATIFAFEEIMLALLLKQARAIRLCSSIAMKIALLALLFVLLRGASAQTVISALLGAFSFIPATLLSLVRHKGTRSSAMPG